MPYETHPTRPHVVLTPDGGIIECLHEAAAQRVCAELNQRDQDIKTHESVIAYQMRYAQEMRKLALTA